MKSLEHKLLVLSSVMWATACSDVSFSPNGDVLGSLNTPVGYQKESFTFNDDGTGAKVDVLFVIDNSTSMTAEQSKLSVALSSFIGSINRLDWQIGITTTDISFGSHGIRGSLVPMKGANTKILNKYVPDYETVFRNTVVRSETIGCGSNCPSGDERPLEAVRMAIEKRDSDNAGFFREGADLVVIVLSDEDEGSDGSNALQPSLLVEHFKNTIGANSRFTGFGILVQPGDSACLASQQPTGGKVGNYVSSFAALTGGLTGSICDNDYGPALAGIGLRVRAVSRSVTLKNLPMPETIQIRMNPFDPDLTWVIEGQTIRFNKTPKKGTRVDIMYVPTQQR